MEMRAAFDWRKWAGRAVLLLLLVLTFVARCHNREQVFHHGGVYFIDGDCYSRMTRARMVADGQWIIRHHDFENWPDGITPHTTAPMDWLIVALRPVADVVLGVLDTSGKSILRRQSLDVAGAFVSPLLGLAVALWLWWWAGRMRLPYRIPMLLLFALSPIAVHGTVLGRPDHQSLLMLLLAVALGCEMRLARSDADPPRVLRAWGIGAGVAWGIALWVSLYEPLVLLAGVLLVRLACDRRNLFLRARLPGWIALAAVVAFALLVDGWRVALPDPALREAFARWSANIGELRHLNPAGTLMWEWLGLLAALTPALLWLAGREDRRAFAALAVVAMLFALTVWQLRWGYFLLLGFAMSLPWQLRALRNPWLARGAFAVALWPFALAWSRTLHPGETARGDQEWRQLSQARVRTIAEKIRREPAAAFLAPWSLSPQIAYWSGRPGIAGSSHESLPGTLDAARFFLSTGLELPAEILRRRKIGWVVADTASFDVQRRDMLLAVTNSAALLGVRIPEEPLALTLALFPRQAPPYLREIPPAELGLVVGIAPKDTVPAPESGIRVYATQMHRLYQVTSELP